MKALKAHIAFETIPWEIKPGGVEQKCFVIDDKQIRLVIFRDTFIEEEWCTKAHVGYVLEGEMILNINGVLSSYKKGDGLFLKEGEANRHKVQIKKGQFVKLLLFESF